MAAEDQPASADDPTASRRHEEIIDLYRHRARRYDALTRALQPARRRAIELLGQPLRAGATILDVGCGTGANFAGLCELTGPSGRVVGVDISANMLAAARARIEAHGWQQVQLLQGDPAEVALPQDADAALFCFTHDLLQSQRTVDAVARALGPGSTAVAVGIKRAPRWALPVNAAVRVARRPFVTDRAGLDRPWRHLEGHVEHTHTETLWFGAVYLWRGIKPV